MERKIDISIIVPIYNVEDYLRQCLDSLAAQSLTTIEVLLVNDGSTDASGDIAKEYAERYPERFIYFEKRNGGLSEARNYAFPYVRGEYLAFVDSDDYVAENMYSELLAAARKSDSDLVECGFYYAYPEKVIPSIWKANKEISLTDYMISGCVCAWNKLYRYSWIKKLKVMFPSGLLYEDLDFFLKIVPYMNKPPVTVPKGLYYYRQRENSIFQMPTERIMDIHLIFQDIFQYYKEKNIWNSYKDELEYKYVRTVFCSFLIKMLKIKDKKTREYTVRRSWQRIWEVCPNWKKNPYVNQLSVRNFYIRTMSRYRLDFMIILSGILNCKKYYRGALWKKF